MTSATYVRIARTLRNRRFFLFSLGFPLVLVAGPNRNEHDLGEDRVSAPLYFMIGLTAFGAMNSCDRGRSAYRARPQRGLDAPAAADSSAAELPHAALITVVALAAAGTTMGVHLSATPVGRDDRAAPVRLLPFAALGILFGHLLTVDSLGPAVGGTTALLWFPIQSGCCRAGAPLAAACSRRATSRAAATPGARSASESPQPGRSSCRRGLGVPSWPSARSRSR